MAAHSHIQKRYVTDVDSRLMVDGIHGQIASSIDKCEFRFYTDDEIEELASGSEYKLVKSEAWDAAQGKLVESTRMEEVKICREVKIKEMFSMNMAPLRAGLHDLRMGGWSAREYADIVCPTCDMSFNQGCPGHFGMIRLFQRVYNPFLMNDLYELLKVQCKGCNKLRM